MSFSGNLKIISELRNSTIFIETENHIQSNKIVQIQTLAGMQVQIAEYSNINCSKGTIRVGERFCNYDDNAFKHELAQYGVVDLYKVKQKIEGSLEDTGTIFPTFEGCNLPNSVKIAWISFEVRQYIPVPRQCSKGQLKNLQSRTR